VTFAGPCPGERCCLDQAEALYALEITEGKITTRIPLCRECIKRGGETMQKLRARFHGQ